MSFAAKFYTWCFVAIFAGCALIYYALHEERIAYEKVCSASGGITIYDGRQYQCFKETK